MTKNNKGFTLIELLVVIAIIGILSSIVLASLSSARNKGKDASAKASVSSVRGSAEIYYNSGTNTYGTVSGGTNATNACVDADVVKLLEAARVQVGGATPYTNQIANTSWASITTTPGCTVGLAGGSYLATVKLNDGSVMCVDSSGNAINVTAAPGGYAAATSGAVKCQ